MGDTEDVFYTKLTTDPEFVKQYFQEMVNTRSVDKDVMDEENMYQLQLGNDVFTIQDEVIAKLLMPNVLQISNLDLEGNLFLDGMAENFRLIFTYYGPQIMDVIEPSLNGLLENINDGPNQAVSAECVSGFMRTIPNYSEID